MSDGPHQGRAPVEGGVSLSDASAAVILFHGRGASAQGILQLADEIDLDDVAYLAPRALGRTWYPQSFLAPIEQNEPHLTSALQVVADLLSQVADAGLGPERVVLMGFSQGACLATEYAARNPQRYGGVVGLSGGLIGPQDEPLTHAGNLDGTPVLLGCSDEDPYIPLARVHETDEVLTSMGADVDTRVYPGLGHTVNADEIDAARDLIAALTA